MSRVIRNAPTDRTRSSRKPLQEAADVLAETENELVNRYRLSIDAMERRVLKLQDKTAEIQRDTWSIENLTRHRLEVLKSQASTENQAAARIMEVAERNAEAILDRISETAGSTMRWAESVGSDMTEMLKEESLVRSEHLAEDIREARAAIEEERRAAELLDLTSQYRRR